MKHEIINYDEKQLTFFNNTYEVFRKAERHIGTVEHYFSIGGFNIKLQFAGPELVPLIIPALQHLSITSSNEIALTVYLWDSESTNTRMPSPPWTLDDYSARGEVWGYNNNGFYTACHKGSGALSVLNKHTNSALWWIRRYSDVPFYESGSPLLTILHWWLQQNGRQIVHAGAVGTKEQGVLLIGKGGSGKSTTTIACLDSELYYAGDDYSLLCTSQSPYVYSLYSSGKLNADHIKRFPHLLSKISNKNRIAMEKPLIFFNQYYSDKLVSGFPVKAIFLPKITGLKDTTLTLTSRIEGLKALAPNTLFQLSSANQHSFSEITNFVRELPCYHLNLGTDINKIPDVIFNFLSS